MKIQYLDLLREERFEFSVPSANNLGTHPSREMMRYHAMTLLQQARTYS